MCNRNKNSNIKEIFKKQNHKAKILSCELYETSLNTNGIFSGNTFNKVTSRLGYDVQKYINPYWKQQQCCLFLKQRSFWSTASTNQWSNEVLCGICCGANTKESSAYFNHKNRMLWWIHVRRYFMFANIGAKDVDPVDNIRIALPKATQP